MAQPGQSLQLVLSLPHTESFAREDFIAGPSNAAALSLVDRWPDWPDRVVALIGPEGSGKSHLASIWAEKTGARILSARALDGASVIDALSTGALVIENLVPPQVDEIALFHLLNLVREERAHLLVTSRSLPATWPIALRDLMSRLRALPVVTVTPPDDALLQALMMKLAADRQIDLDPALLSYLVQRLERSFSAVRSAIVALDREALRQKRPISRALAAELFRDDAA
ncbi:MAG TPA: DnaA/Hda family protein [Pseudolabrys sp.]|jgi:chromosomal replication initiation ATPase DnaA|nr:DnaA/Hda family protein [Pseudolabrys sp.]